ncbi:hypothetical protein D9Q98_004158 [Chlorella vulgaris]|uniref:Uncharacterized protein n=1 Tax=Chlorella vulgaris TaxID=3077 RepID=A0A9D4YYA6_CHLVU|nr:hypothetical protein D9Q98_004158 [Chlorella vulgaris]
MQLRRLQLQFVRKQAKQQLNRRLSASAAWQLPRGLFPSWSRRDAPSQETVTEQAEDVAVTAETQMPASMQVGYASSAQAQASIAYGESDLISAAEAEIARADVTIARADAYFAAIAEQDRRLQSEAAVFRERAHPLPPSQAQPQIDDSDAFWVAVEAQLRLKNLAEAETVAFRALAAEQDHRQRSKVAVTEKLAHNQRVSSAAMQSHATPTLPPWQPLPAGPAPSSRAAAAEASAAAAMAWATAAMGLEARAARTAGHPAAERSHVDLQSQAAAAAWRASYQQLEYAKQADLHSSAVRRTEQSIRDMRSFKRQCQQWGEAS